MSSFCLSVLPIELDEHGVVNLCPEYALHSVHVHAVAVRG